MGPFKAVDSVFTQYATFRGRASRSEYWWWVLMNTIILLCAFAGDVYLYDPFAPASLNPLAYFTAFWMLVTILPSIAVCVRRLHDAGYSGVWYLLNFVPFGSLIVIVFNIFPSEEGGNGFGPSPHGGGGSTYGRYGLDDPHIIRKPVKADPYAPYAALERARQPKSADAIAAQKQEVNDYFRDRVLKKA